MAEAREGGQVASPTRGRLLPIDVLRTVAVLMVLFRHISLGRGNPGLHGLVATLSAAPLDLLHAPLVAVRAVYLAGWAGVDLFFVLSGYLVSGLLFGEYRRYGALRVGRFLVRRGLKIYPSFYVFLGLTAVAGVALHASRPALNYVSEALFVQNYGPNVWGHTWSLAVEEHFYLLLSLLLWQMARRGGPDPFRALPSIFLGVALTVTALRVLTWWSAPVMDHRTHYFPTHLRIDALFFGVLLSYIHHFAPGRLAFLVGPRRRAILLASALLIAPMLLLEQLDARMYLFGLPMLYLGFGGLLMLAVTSDGFEAPSVAWLTRPLGFIGVHSYSIYLWHAAVVTMGVPLAMRLVHRVAPAVGDGWAVELILYLGATMVVGIGMARLVELPVLAVRDRLFPARSAAT